MATSWPSDPPANAPFTGTGLLNLLNDAAYRANSMLVDHSASGLQNDPLVDLARRASTPLPSALRKALAASAGLTVGSLDQQSIAFKIAGPEGVHTLNEKSWTPSPSDAARAAETITAHHQSEPTTRANAFSVDDVRYTLSQSGRWARFVRRSGRWRLDSPLADTLDELLTDTGPSDG